MRDSKRTCAIAWLSSALACLGLIAAVTFTRAPPNARAEGVEPSRASAEPAPELVVERAQPMRNWASAAEAPLYASSGNDGRIDFWDPRDGTQLRTVALPEVTPEPGTRVSPRPVVLSNDGRSAAVAADGLTLISTSDGTSESLRAARDGRARPVTFSPDGKTLAIEARAAPDPNTLQTPNGAIALLSLVGRPSVPIPGSETDAAYSPDGASIATLTHARDRLLLFDVRRHRLRSVSDGGGVYGPLAYSPDGTLLASLGDDPSIPPNGKGIFEPTSTDHELFVNVWDLRRGRLAARLPWQTVHPGFPIDEQAPGAFAFGDSRTLAIDEEKRTLVYDTGSLTVKARLDHEDYSNYGNEIGLAVTPYRVGGTLGFLTERPTELAFTHWTGDAKATDATIPFPAMVGNIAIDRSGRTLGVDLYSRDKTGASQRDAVAGVDLATLRWISLPARQKNPLPIKFLTDGRLALPSPCALLYVHLATTTSVRHDVPGDVCERSYPGFAGLSISTDGQTLFAGNDSGLSDLPNGGFGLAHPVAQKVPLQAYDVATGHRRYVIDGMTGLPVACASQHPQCAFPQRASIPNLAISTTRLHLVIMDASTQKLMSAFELHALIGGAGFVDSDKQLIVRETLPTNVETDTVDIVDPRRGTLERQIPVANGDITFAAAAPLFAVTSDSTMKIFDTSGAVVSTLTGVNGDATLFPGGAKVAVLAPDGTLAVRSTKSGQLLLTLAFFSHADALEWLAYTPDGFYSGSPFGRSLIRWRYGERILPGAAFATRFHRPDRVAAALRVGAALR